MDCPRSESSAYAQDPAGRPFADLSFSGPRVARPPIKPSAYGLESSGKPISASSSRVEPPPMDCLRIESPAHAQDPARRPFSSLNFSVPRVEPSPKDYRIRLSDYDENLAKRVFSKRISSAPSARVQPPPMNYPRIESSAHGQHPRSSGNKVCIVFNCLRDAGKENEIIHKLCVVDLDANSIVGKVDDKGFAYISPTLQITSGICTATIQDALCVGWKPIYV